MYIVFVLKEAVVVIGQTGLCVAHTHTCTERVLARGGTRWEQDFMK